MEECLKVFERLKIPGKMKRFHRKLIFEDDVIPSPEYNEKYMIKASEFVRNDKNWDIFYLGHQPDVFFSCSEVVDDNIIKTYSTLTHAYVLSRKFMKKIMNRPYDGTAIDKIFLKNDNSYAIYPMQFYQSDSSSDIAASAPIRGLRYSELYSYYVNYPIFYFLAIFITLILILIIFFILNRYF